MQAQQLLGRSRLPLGGIRLRALLADRVFHSRTDYRGGLVPIASLALAFDITARDSASPSFRKVGDSAEKAGKQTSAFGTLTAGAMKTAGAAIAGIAVGRLFAGFIEDARESAKVSRLTAQVIQTTGSAAHITAKQVGELADAISNKTGIDDEQIQSAENLLLTFTKVRNEVGKGNDVFDRATQLAVDMSVVLGTDASGAAIQLGKALNDPIKGIGALSRAGVSFTAEQKDQIRTLVESGDVLSAQKIILEELGTEFGGAAEAASDPLQRLATVAGNLGEDVGTLLLPYIEDFANFTVDTLIPAIKDGAAWFRDHLGPAVGVAADALGAIFGVVSDLFDAFTDLPGPIQIGLVAFAGLAALKGPISSTFETMAIKALYAKDAIKDAATNVGGLKGALAGLAGAAATLVTITVLAKAIGDVIEFTNAGDDARETVDNLSDSLAGLEGPEKIDANKVAIQQLRQELEGYQHILDDYENESILHYLFIGQFSASDIADAQEAVGVLTDEINRLEGESATAAGAVPLLGGVIAETGEQAAASQEALDEWLKELQGIAEGFVEPLSAYQDLLAQKQQAEQESAQATADATDDASDSWEDYANDVSVTLDEYAQTLEDQLAAQDTWRENIGIIAQRAGTDVANYLAQMGEDGVQIVADMATGTDAEVQRMAAAILADIQAGGSDWTGNMQHYMDVMAAIGASGGKATVQGLAAQLGLGVDEVRDIANQYGLNLAEGVNPIIAALGRPIVQVDRLRGGFTAGFADGGWTGPGGKYTPAGFVHGNEYVEPTESLAYYGRGIFEALHKRSIPREMITGLPGYANGGFVTEADIPRPYSTSPYGPPISTAGDAAMDAEYSAAAAFVRESGPWGRGLSWARTQVGKPYIWGGVGPTGYDCSGFMSAITNVILGQSPYSRRGATANFPWPGFASGDGQFTIGSTPNAGGGIGHMAGTLLGVNVESRGGQGVVVGTSARGAHDGLFGTRAHLATYDRGGVLPPGLTLAYNGTGKDEYVSKGMGGPVVITGTLRIDGDGLAHIVDGRIDQAFGDVHDRALYAGGGN